ncbi:MAG: hypothetical protein M1831_002017 [Alyxoria varia]|nr:MAG: hypothetical protein M1831_002017 [Alyxoria varia]
MSKIEKTIARQKQRISEGQYYEAHQQLRVITSRYLKSNPPNYDAAIDLLSSGALALFDAGQGGSGGDLCLYLVDVYKQAELKPDSASKDHDVYEAERHLVLGTRDSVPILARLEYDWYASDEPSTAGIYASRAVFPLLLVGNLRGANQALLLFTSQLGTSNPQLVPQEVSSGSADLRLYPSIPLLNFLSLLLLAVQRGSSNLFRNLRAQYANHIAETDGMWDEALEHVGEMFFGIRAPKQSNPLMDMMGSFFGGGAGGAGASKARQQKAETPAPAPGVD